MRRAPSGWDGRGRDRAGDRGGQRTLPGPAPAADAKAMPGPAAERAGRGVDARGAAGRSGFRAGDSLCRAGRALRRGRYRRAGCPGGARAGRGAGGARIRSWFLVGNASRGPAAGPGHAREESNGLGFPAGSRELTAFAGEVAATVRPQPRRDGVPGGVERHRHRRRVRRPLACPHPLGRRTPPARARRPSTARRAPAAPPRRSCRRPRRCCRRVAELARGFPAPLVQVLLVPVAEQHAVSARRRWPRSRSAGGRSLAAGSAPPVVVRLLDEGRCPTAARPGTPR